MNLQTETNSQTTATVGPVEVENNNNLLADESLHFTPSYPSVVVVFFVIIWSMLSWSIRSRGNIMHNAFRRLIISDYRRWYLRADIYRLSSLRNNNNIFVKEIVVTWFLLVYTYIQMCSRAYGNVYYFHPLGL